MDIEMEDIIGFIVSIAVLVGIIFGVFAIFEVNTPRERASVVARVQCTDLGYQFNYDKLNVWYCIDLGLEPRVLRLGTLAELEVQYER